MGEECRTHWLPSSFGLTVERKHYMKGKNLPPSSPVCIVLSYLWAVHYQHKFEIFCNVLNVLYVLISYILLDTVKT